MNNKITRPLLLALALASALLAGAPGAAGDDLEARFEQKLNVARGELGQWHFGTADEMSRDLIEMAEGPGGTSAMKAKARLFRASYYFFNGDYALARDELDIMGEHQESGEELPALYDRSAKLAEIWSGAAEIKSEHFRVRYVPGRDEVLIGPSIETLEAAYGALSADFGHKPEGPILVEIYPSFEGFRYATNLSEEALDNSGTIAVCKYRRLMVNTPRNLLRGYNYRDTLSHELVHFVIYDKYGERIPIWLHEGLAKYEEDRWRLDKAPGLSPYQQSLLASAFKENALISFDRMHPSFAYLKTPRQGQLAFAEVTSVIDYLLHLGGWDLVFKVCDEHVKNPDYRAAIRNATGVPFDRFWEEWQAYARSQGYEEIPGLEITALEIRKGEADYEEVDEEVGEEDLAEGEEWRYVRLGDLLRDREHYNAALVEYRRARREAPYSPRILNKLGLCHYLAGDHENGIEPLEEALRVYPHHVNTLINLGRNYYALGKTDEAIEAFEKSLDVNPFNPVPYPYLLEAYDKAGDADKVKALSRNYMIVSGRYAPGPETGSETNAAPDKAADPGAATVPFEVTGPETMPEAETEGDATHGD